MRSRIVVADQAEARIHDFDPRDSVMLLVLQLSNTAARLHDRDLKSDRPGRVFDCAPSAGGRRKREFDSLTSVAGQPFRGILLAALGERLNVLVATIVAKDLVHESERALRAHIARNGVATLKQDIGR